MRMIRLILLLSAGGLAFPALAQQSESGEGTAERGRPGGDDLHDRIVVTAPGLDRLDVLAGTSVLDDIELQRSLEGQIGDVLTRIPGVSASSFTPGASRPILRGFGGERVRVLTDGVGVIDASAASADHAVSLDPLITQRVEVLRGPATLLYGNQAIGGAVNVITKRIPPAVPDEPIHVDALGIVDSAYDRLEGGLSIDIPLGSSIAFHLDGSYRDTGDLEVPGFVASDALRADLLADAAEEEQEGAFGEAEELREAANRRGVVPNSFSETWSVGTGIAFFSGASNFGVSFDYYDTNYGIPGFPGFGHGHGGEGGEEGAEEEEEAEGEEEIITIGLERYRVDVRGVLDLGNGFFDEGQARFGYSDYIHTEFEGEEVGTIFDVEGVEGRVELVQSARGGWRGLIGGQFSHTDFVAVGEEAFIPANTTDNYALFALQEVDFEPFELELAARYERTDVDASDSIGLSRDFDTVSGAVGLGYEATPGIRAGVNLSRAERAPSATELFADGPHAATRQFEIGDPELAPESSWGIEGYVRGDIGPVRFSASIYRNWFDGFIYLQDSGGEEDGLPVFSFLQQDADQFGLEGEIKFPLVVTDGYTLIADLRGDYVRATLDDGSPLPRIPPVSLLGALEARTGHIDARAEVEYFSEQDRVAAFETPTEDFTFVNMSVAWHPFEGAENLTVIAQANNLFDETGRRHASFTKEYVPLPGRNFRLSVRVSY